MLFISVAYCQTGFNENFNDGNLSGWSGSADYILTNTGNELKVDVRKTSTWSSFTFSFTNTDISSNPYVRMRIKSDVDININFFINTDQSYGNAGNPREIIHSDGYTDYIFDFSGGQSADLGGANMLNFVCNPGGAQGCNATIYIDDIRIGTDAPAIPSISRIQDQFHGINASEITIPFWRVEDLKTGASPLNITASSSNTGLIPDPVVNYIPGNSSGTLVYTPVANQAGIAVITVTISGNSPEDNVMQFDVTVENNKAPKISQINDLNVQSGVLTDVAFSGLDDGDANENQTLSITAVSSDTTILPDPSILYSAGDFGGILHLNPVAGHTGIATVTVTVQDNGGTLAGGDDTLTMKFDVMVYTEVNNAPALNELVDMSILEDDPEQIVYLRGITDGDEPEVSYVSGNSTGTLTFTPVTDMTGTANITVTLTDDGEPVGVRSEKFSVTVLSPTGIHNTMAGKISLWPNPVKETLHVNTAGNNITSYSMLSSQGRVIDGGSVVKQQFALNTSGLSNGVYILLLKSDNQTITLKFVKQTMMRVSLLHDCVAIEAIIVVACSPDVSQSFPADIVRLDSQGIYQFPYFHCFQNMGIKSFPHIVVIYPGWCWPKTSFKLHRPVEILTYTLLAVMCHLNVVTIQLITVRT
jgi:hypothetical protein